MKSKFKAIAILFAVAMGIAVVAPSIEVRVETNSALACPFDDPDCNG